MWIFYIGGIVQVVDSLFVEVSYDGIVDFKNKNIVKDSQGCLVVMSCNLVLVIKDVDGKEFVIYKIL